MLATKPTRAVCLMIHDNHVLVMHRKKVDEEYYTFVGGGVEEGETIEEAVVREVMEETMMPTKLDRLLYIHDYTESEQYYYLCKYISGEPVLGESTEKERMTKASSDIYGPEWMPIELLDKRLLYPLEIRDWLIEDLANGFKTEVRKATINIPDLRQSL